jgi:exportin-1
MNLRLIQLVRSQIEAFVECLVTMNASYEKFRLQVRDFLISLKEFAGDNAELYVVEKEQEARDKLNADHERRAKVGGLLKPSEIEAEDDEL